MTSIRKSKANIAQGDFVFLLLFLVYFGSNLVYYAVAMFDESMVIDGVEFNVAENFSWSLILTLIFLVIQYFIVINFRVANVARNDYSDVYRQLLHVSLGYQVVFYFYNAIYGYGVAGQSVSQDSVFKYLFYIVSPDLLVLITSVLVVKSRLYYFNLFFLVFSMLARGWAGGAILLGFVLLINSSYSGIQDFSKKAGFRIILILAFGVILVPVLNAFKFWVRDGGSEDFVYYLNYNLGDDGFFSVVGTSILYLLSRFSIVGSVNIIYDNQAMLRDAYASGAIVPYWSENTLISSFYRMWSVEGVNASNYVATEILRYSDATWNTHVGLVGWMIILPAAKALLFYFYYLTALFFALFLSRMLGDRAFAMVSVLSLIYLYHGWLSSYILVIYCLLFVVFFRSFFSRPKDFLVTLG